MHEGSPVFCDLLILQEFYVQLGIGGVSRLVLWNAISRELRGLS